jgi:hypothetical protein
MIMGTDFGGGARSPSCNRSCYHSTGNDPHQLDEFLIIHEVCLNDCLQISRQAIAAVTTLDIAHAERERNLSLASST